MKFITTLAFAAGVPCRLDRRSTRNDLNVMAARELVNLCSTRCPVLEQCKALADLRPNWEKLGSVIAGEYFKPRRGVPRWVLLYEDLRDRVLPEYRAGETLPHASVLAVENSCHIAAANAALVHLEQNGLITYDGVSGYRVATSARADGQAIVA